METDYENLGFTESLIQKIFLLHIYSISNFEMFSKLKAAVLNNKISKTVSKTNSV